MKPPLEEYPHTGECVNGGFLCPKNNKINR